MTEYENKGMATLQRNLGIGKHTTEYEIEKTHDIAD